MTKAENSAVRTRKEQARDLASDMHLWGKSSLDVRLIAAARQIKEAEARGAAEERRKGGEGCERWEFEEPEYHDQGMGCGLEDRGIHDRYQAMEYGWDQAVERCIERIPEELYTRPANVAALEARIAELTEAEQLARADAEASKARVEKLKRVALDVLQVCQRSKMGPSDLGYVTKMIRAALTREGGV